MRSKLAFSVFLVASLFGATTLASAQTQPAAGAPVKSSAATSNAMASMHHHHPLPPPFHGIFARPDGQVEAGRPSDLAQGGGLTAKNSL